MNAGSERRCPNGHPVGESAQFCGTCGSSVATVTCPNGHAMGEGASFCEVCGEAAPASGSRANDLQGSDVADNSPEPSSTPPRSEPATPQVPAAAAAPHPYARSSTELPRVSPAATSKKSRKPWLVVAGVAATLAVLGAVLVGVRASNGSDSPSATSATPVDQCTRAANNMKGEVNAFNMRTWLRTADSAGCTSVLETYVPEYCRMAAGMVTSDAAYEQRKNVYQSMKDFDCDMEGVAIPAPSKEEAAAIRAAADKRLKAAKKEADKESGGGSSYSFVSGQNIVGYKFVKNPTCDYFSCYQVEVKAIGGSCPSGVYLEIDLVGSGGTVIGYSNDVLGSLRDGEKGLLTLNVTEDGVQSARVNEINCWS